MKVRNRTVLVTGGSRGLGRGLVEALSERGAKVMALARASEALQAVGRLPGVGVCAADVTAPTTAADVLARTRPDIVVLNAGAAPPMGRLDEISWEDFTAVWDHDVKAGLFWMQAALNLPLAPGARVVVVSSGAAIDGSPMSGGYAGAKRMLWMMARYANRVSEQRQLGIRFQVVLPRQMILGTGIGDRAAGAYAQANGVTPEAFVTRFGAPMPPRLFGAHLVDLLEDEERDAGFAFGVSGSGGVQLMEPMAT